VGDVQTHLDRNLPQRRRKIARFMLKKLGLNVSFEMRDHTNAWMTPNNTGKSQHSQNQRRVHQHITPQILIIVAAENEY
jgi:hypothetical protein